MSGEETSATMRLLARLTDAGCDPRLRGEQWEARCPAHDDQRPSLSVSTGDDGRALVHCYAGCRLEDVLGRLHLHTSDLFAEQEVDPRPAVRDTYSYVDEAGELLFEVVRFDPKDFRQRRPDGAGGWEWRLDGVRRVLFRLPEVIQAVQEGREVWIAEGEKDVLALERAGVVATCNPGGAGKWRDEYSAVLEGAIVIVVADRDEPGRKHATQVAASLHGVARSVRVVEARAGKDAADHLAASLGLEEFVPWEEADHAQHRAAPVLVAVSTVSAEHVSWLWPGRIAIGKVGVLDGDPGLGKSTLMCDVGARVSTGSPFPDGAVPPRGDVIILTAEDGIADTVRPRLEAAGADLDHVHVLEGVQPPDGPPRPWSLPADLDVLREAVKRTDAVLVVIDPLMAFLHGSVNSWRDQDVRGALHPLAKLAEELGVAILLIRHLTKSGGNNALYRGGGSIGIIGAARTGLVVCRDPDDEHRCVLAVSKSNLGATADSLAFRVQADPDLGCGRIEWEGTSPHSADALLAEADSQEERSKRGEIEEVLRHELADGPRLREEVLRAVRAAGVTADDRTFRRACERLGVKRSRDGFGRGAQFTLSMPDAADKASEHHPQPVHYDEAVHHGSDQDLFEGSVAGSGHNGQLSQSDRDGSGDDPLDRCGKCGAPPPREATFGFIGGCEHRPVPEERTCHVCAEPVPHGTAAHAECKEAS